MVLTTYQTPPKPHQTGLQVAPNGPFRLNTRYRKLLADTLTPVSIYLSLRDHYANAILLESSDYHSRKNSYSYICCQPIAGFELQQGLLKCTYPGKITEEKVLEETGEITQLERFTGRFEVETNDFEFVTNGFFGYTSYEAVQYFESIELHSEAEPIPEMLYQLYRYVLVLDHHRNELHLFEHSEETEVSTTGIDQIEALVKASDFGNYAFQLTAPESSNLSDEAYKEMVEQGRQHCLRGDTFQMVLSRRFTRGFTGDEFNVYRSLRAINPSPYLFYFDYGNFKIFGSSPEAQLTIRSGKATIHPIAGTYKRTGDATEDRRLAEALKQDDKENSEHVMLVDLARNDLSRYGEDVQVESFREVQLFSHVMHLVSTVTAQVAPETVFKLQGATFPAGTLSGAPKYKAMQLIDKYEPCGRGFYGGAIGFIGFNGDYNHAILIRSFLSRSNELIYQAGAGVVAESVPENELQEVYNKIGALRKALENATQL